MFSRLSIPTPFQVGPVNAYLAGRTLVDPGPDSEEAWAKLLAALEERDLSPDDVEQVLITHPHPDHFGVAHRLRERGARVLASPEARSIVEDFPARLEHEQAYFVDFFEQCGMARETAETVTNLPEAFLAYATSVDVDRELEAGDDVNVDDVHLTADAVTGHAPGELLFAFEEGDERVALVGDNVLADITPNPFLQPPPESGGPRPRVLPGYNESLRTLRADSFDRFLPGHREPIDAPAARIDAILTEHDERTDEVSAIVDGPTAPVEVMGELFGDLPATEQFSGMSEAVGHLDVLEDREIVTKRERGGLVVYERV
ncbi:MBL fold metallo-hydrolase [Halobacteria archaeon HArc-gm2]|nr:MBL fold metallo-hydrolase [Halobacteria archaeon HArc-gm2]